MDFSLEYTKEQEEFAKEVREWLDKNVPKDLVSPRDRRKMSYEQWQKRRELGRKLGEKGWLRPGYPRQYGGGGLDMDHCLVLHQEMDERHLGLPPYYDSGGGLSIPPIMSLGTEEQKKRLLPPIMKGEVVTWELFTEPEAGTDEANQQTNALRAVREKDHFIVNGQKIFVGGAPGPPEHAPPEQFLLLTRSDLEAPRHGNLALFVCPANLPGITIQHLGLFLTGDFGQVCGPATDSASGDKNSVFFDDVRIHESYLIGGDHAGWRAATATLEVEHGGSEGAGVRVPRKRSIYTMGKLFAQCKSNPNIVKRLNENPHLLDSVVNIYIGAQIERLFGLRNAWLGDSGRRAPYAGPQLSLYGKMLGARFVRDMAAILGPYALTDDTEWGLEEDIFEVNQRGGVILAPGGTPEAQKIVISRALAIGR